MKVRLLTFLGIISLLAACSSDKQRGDDSTLTPVIISDNGYTVPKKDISEPDVVPAGAPVRVNVGRIAEQEGYSNLLLAGTPRNVKILTPKICTIGQNGFGYPVIVRAVSKPIFCKAPEVVLAKDAYVKDVNPQNFCSFSKLQGLEHDQIRSLTQDSMGNLWLGTDDGVTKYDGKYFSRYSVEQGLRNNLILSVIQDSKANMWFGTFDGGVTRYDGRYFTNFSKEDGLPSNVVNCVFEDISGNIWLGTGAGAVKYDGKSFTNFTKKEGLCGNDVRSIIQDDSGRIWISTFNAGVSIFNGKSFLNFSEEQGLVQNFITFLQKDKAGNIWLATGESGVIKYDGSQFTSYTEKEGLCNNSIRTILQDDKGAMWFGSTEQGLSRFDGKFFTSYGAKDGLGANYIRCSIEDKNGDLWFGTRGAGLVHFSGNIFTHLTSNEGLSNSRVMDMLQDKSGNFWFGTFGGYVTKLSYKEEDGIKRPYFSVFGEKEGLPNTRIYSLIQDREGNIWFGADGGGVSSFDGKTTVCYMQKQGLCGNSIRKIYQDRAGNFWFASYGDGVSKFDGKSFTNYGTKQGFSSNKVLAILEDKGGKMWFGTDGGGVTLLDGEKIVQYTESQGFFNNIVYSIIKDKDGIIWFGTGGSGLIRYDGKEFAKYSEDFGLNNGHILSLMQDSKGNIWAGTRFGINILKAEDIRYISKGGGTPRFRSYNYEDGFIGIGCNLGAIMESKEGEILIGTNDRLTTFHPESERENTSPSNLQLTNIQLFNENIPWTELALKKDTSILLSNGVKVGKFRFDSISRWYGLPENLSLFHGHNYLTFSFIGISMRQNTKIRYQYMLQGLDNDWNKLTDRTEVSYGNLKSGKYVFRVKAINCDGKWSREVNYNFTIRPPWWSTWWFCISFVLFILVLVYSIMKFRERLLYMDKQRLEQQVILQTRQLTEKNRELLIINSEKDKLFSIIAHDLRSPLNSFLGLTQIMTEELQNLSMDQLQEIAVSMRGAANNLYRLLENLLQWSRIQQRSIQPNPEAINLLFVVSECISIVQESARAKGIEILLDIPENTEVFADVNMFKTVIRNLVSNSVKFTPKNGKVTISASSVKDMKIEVSVRDTGIGMSSAIVENLFSMDIGTSRSGTEGEPSTGLGLIICKEFIERQGGMLYVESKEGKGSTFTFTVPVA